ncbi:hypothetical protein [Nocardioides kribbensis]|uniref:hypothetical protein n=1 Tax=Nocardioides kribbensis TaxID=305517 RepID=UPI0032DA5D1D
MTDAPRPVISDDEVARLPLSAGRADLMEQIMSTPVLDHPATTSTDRPRRRWPAVAASAAAVALVAAAPLLLRDGTPAPAGPAGSTGQPAPACADVPGTLGATGAAVTGPFGWLAVDGWRATYVAERNVSYTGPAGDLEITRYDADAYPCYVADRAEVPLVGEVDLLGRTSDLRAYGPTDHAVMRSPQDGSFIEVRGSGMDEAAFRDLLAGVRLTDEATFAEALPESVVTPAEVRSTMEGMLEGVETPPGFDLDDVKVTGYNTRYHVGAPLTAAVTCGWVAVYAEAAASDDDAADDAAVSAMRASRDWPVLREMAPQGDWSPWIWQVGDDMAAGRDPQRIAESSGC